MKPVPGADSYVIDEGQSQKFIDYFFKDVPDSDKQSSGKISPKILIVEKEKRLSWQYHHRRAELWKVIAGEVGVITSDTDEENSGYRLKKKEMHYYIKTRRTPSLDRFKYWGVVLLRSGNTQIMINQATKNDISESYRMILEDKCKNQCIMQLPPCINT